MAKPAYTFGSLQALRLSDRKRFGATLAAFVVAVVGALNAHGAAREVNEVLNLTDNVVVSLDLPVVAAAGVSVEVPINGVRSTLTLHPHSARAPGFELLIQLDDGSFTAIDPGPVRTLRGTLEEWPGSVAAGLLADEGLYARIFLPDGSEHWIEPLAGVVAGATANDHVVYRGADALAAGGDCELLDEQAHVRHPAVERMEFEGGVAGGYYITELVCEADVEYFQQHNSHVQTTQNKIENIINNMNVQYENQLDISHLITVIVVRTAEPDPYSTNSASGLLNAFRNVWLQNPPSDANHDVAQLFTGRNIVGDNGNSGTIGVAWLNGVCTSQGYSVVENCCQSMACLTDLSAHELGHNWNAPHCCGNCNPTCPTSTMNPSLTCTNSFATVSQNTIIQFRNTRTCLNLSDPLLRIIISGPLQVNEGTVVQYTATAQYVLGPNQDVTANTTWWVEPPSVGFFTAPGLFTALNVNGDTPATIMALYTDNTGSDADARAITVIDLDEPDPRTVRVQLVPQLELGSLCVGESFTADVLLSAPDGDIADVRLIQLDSSLTSGLIINDFEWTLHGLTDDALYLLFEQGSVYAATYIGQTPLPGLILGLTSAPQVVARVQATVMEEGALNLCGVMFPPFTDQSVRVQSGFSTIAEFSQAIGNVTCEALVVNPGSGSREILASQPPRGAIDARQPSNLNGSNPVGWSSVVLTFNCVTDEMTAADFVLSFDPPAPGPAIESVSPNGTQLTVTFDGPIPPGAWTTITHVAGGSTVRLGYLPADVNGDGTSSPVDILVLIDHLNGVLHPPLSLWQSDINRSGATEPSDVLRVIDLLNGADAFDVWNGATLP